MFRKDPPPPIAGGVIIGKRLAAVQFAPQFLASIIVPGPTMHVCVQGIPADATINAVGVHPQTGMFFIVFEHPSFPMPLGNGALPEIQVQFNHYQPSDQAPQVLDQLKNDAPNSEELIIGTKPIQFSKKEKK